MSSPPLGCFIEISGRCNGRCPYCVKGNGTQPPGGFIAPETFENLLEFLEKNSAIPASREISLFNWGEPFLHPQIEKILLIANSFNLRGFFSSNLLYLPELSVEALAAISGIRVSLSGFTQESYGRIHGGNLPDVLRNLDELIDRLKAAGLKWMPHIYWHIYRFNESERPAARDYFAGKGIRFDSTVANLSDIQQVIELFVKNAIPDNERTAIEKDIFTDYHEYSMDLYSQETDFACRFWDYLTINEKCEALLCCGWRETTPGVVLGSIFDLPLDELPDMKRSSGLCAECIRCGMPQYGFRQTTYHFDEYQQRINRDSMGFLNRLRMHEKSGATG